MLFVQQMLIVVHTMTELTRKSAFREIFYRKDLKWNGLIVKKLVKYRKN